VLGIVAISLIGFAILIKQIAKEALLTKRAEREKTEADAETARALAKRATREIAQDGYGMLHLIDHSTGHSQNLTLDARAYRNGHYEDPKPTEAENLRLILAAKHASTSKMLIEQARPAQLPSPQLDFFTALSDPLQAYAIIGPQRIGKSVLLQQLAHRLADYGQRCIVIGTKAEPHEWPGCERFIGGPSDSIVPDALLRIYSEAEERIRQNVKAPLVAVVLDDWLNTAEIWPVEAERFFVEAATRMLTAGYVPYFVLQSDSKSDWGIKHGAQLKNNFTHLFLTAPRASGRIDYNRLKCFIIYPGDKEQHQVRLPFAAAPLLPEPVILRPGQQEQQIITLYEAGTSMNEIARQVYGHIGGNQNKAIKEILGKYGYVSM